MSRLIDVDAFKEYIKGAFEDNKGEFKTDKYMRIAESVTEGFLKDIDEQPTAFDLDKVVERLKKKINPLHNVNWNSAIEEAIEIVKGGGVNERFN